MKNVNYEKPSMHFVNLRNDRAVADDHPCMAQAAHGHTTFYFDVPGDGWVIITTDAENCSGNATFQYYDNPDIPGTIDEAAQRAAIARAKAALNADKQQFAGAYLEPQSHWS